MAGVVADRVIVELEAKLDRYNANVLAAQRSFERAMGSMSNDAKRMEAQVRASLGGVRTVLLSTASLFTASLGASGLARAADTYTRFTNQLRLAGLEGRNLSDVQDRLYQIAQKNGVPLQALGTLYGRVAQSARELGANQQQLLQLSSGVAAALRIQGGSAEETNGALLQLSQLLGTGVVRAEEFNSVNEGARPILQAVASGIDKYRGSVSRLRQDVVAGNVTSREFFEGFLRGSAALEEQATRANLTIAGSFQVLSNAFTRYIGQADAAHGSTRQISAAIVALADNLDILIPALVNLGILLGSVWLGRFVSGLVAASAATGVFSAAIFALQARAIGAATTMEALGFTARAAGASMLSAFGGPVGLAVTALTVGLIYFSSAADEAKQASDNVATANAQLAAELASVHTQQRAADASSNSLNTAQRAALVTTANLTGEANLLAQAWARVAAAAKAAALEQAHARVMTAATNLENARGAYSNEVDANAPVTPLRALRNRPAPSHSGIDDAQHNLDTAARAYVEEQRRRLADYRANVPAAAGGGSGRHGRGGRGRAGPSADDTTRKFENERSQIESQLRDASAELLNTREARVAAELANIEADRQRASREIDGQDHLDNTRKGQLQALNDQLAAARRGVVLAEQEDNAREQATHVATAQADNESDLLRAQMEITDSTSARRDIALRLLEIQYDRERLEINAQLQARGLSDVEKRILEARLEYLDRIEAAGRQQVQRENETPLQRYQRELRKTPEQMNEDFERVAVSGLEALNNGLVDAITGAKSLGDVFHNIANQIIADLLRIAIQQAIIKPLAELLGGGSSGGSSGGGGGFFSSLFGSLFGGGKTADPGWLASFAGKASGGHVSAGKMYRVTDGEGFQASQSGKIIPLGQMNSATAGAAQAGQPVVVRLIVGANDYFDVRVQEISGNVSVRTVRGAAPSIIDAAANETFRRAARPEL